MKKKVSQSVFGSLPKTVSVLKNWRVVVGAAFFAAGLVTAAIFWQPVTRAEKQQANPWQAVEASAIANRAEGLPAEFAAFQLDNEILQSALAASPHEASGVALNESELVLQLPAPDGGFRRYRVQESPVLDEGLQARLPELKSYRVLGIDEAATTGRFDLTPNGFHATIISPGDSYSILPADANDNSLYAVYSATAQPHLHEDSMICSLAHDNGIGIPEKRAELDAPAPEIARGKIRKTYRMAFSTTFKYSQAFGCTVADCTNPDKNRVVASINTWLSGLNAIYERELTVKMEMVNDLDAIFVTSASSPVNYFDENTDADFRAGKRLNEVRNQLKDKVGEANYDIGHLMTNKTIGGVAGINAVCDDDTRGEPIDNAGTRPTVGHRKGGGYSEMFTPVGNLVSLKLFAHEIGHQFGANHSHNSSQGRDQMNTQYEPGSGNTIMSYFGITPGDNLVGIRDMRFHGISYDQMTAWISTPVGGQCGTTNNTGNTEPTVNAGVDRMIPKDTPFTLTATGSDPNPNDHGNVTYTWEQFQAAGNATTYAQDGTPASYTDAGDPATTTRPIFRATEATRSVSRMFPSLEYILNNENNPPDGVPVPNSGNPPVMLRPGEELPQVERTSLVFRVTARDNVGGVNNDEMTIAVKGNAGPFKVVNDPTGTWTGGSTQTVAWNVANTGAGTDVNTANVRISLSTDGGQSFPITLAHSTTNDGSEQVFVPNNIVTSAARIKVEAIDNIFFDVSSTNFSITPNASACPLVTDISPKVAVVGSTVQITGINLTSPLTVTFSDNKVVPAVDVIYFDGTKIEVKVPTNAVGGAINVTKNGCAAAQSTNFTVCSGVATEQNNVDDGSFWGTDGAFRGMSYHVNRITPTSYPATLSEVKIYHQTFDGFPVNKAINIISAANPSGGTNINNLNFKTRAAKIAVLDTFSVYKVEPITITSGDFVVGFSFKNEVEPNDPYFPSPVAVDPKNPVPPHEQPQPLAPNRSYSSSDGKTFAKIRNTDGSVVYLIRAIAYNSQCTSARCAAAISVDDGTLESAGSPGNTGTHYYVNRLTPSSYPATITGIRLQTPLPANTSINLLTAASPDGRTSIDNTTFKTKAATVVAPNQFDVYTVDPLTIYSGDFLIGYSVVRNAGSPAVSIDLTPLIQNRSYYNANANGTSFTLDPNVNYPIRAVLYSNNCSVGSCTYSYTTSGVEFSAEGGESTITINTQPGCPWQLSRRNDWLSVNLASGTGSGTVGFDVKENRIRVFRTGSFVVGSPNGGGNLLGGGAPPETEDVLEILVTQEAAAPTAASVTVGGRVSAGGRGVGRAFVTLTDQNGATRTVQTNPFGYYRFDEVSAGQTVIVSVYSKRYNFAPQAVSVMEEIENLDFRAQ